MDNKKIIMIDTNTVTSDCQIMLSNYVVEYFGLKDGIEILAYQDADVWEATVHRNPSAEAREQWWVELGENIQILTDEEMKWNWAGYYKGECSGEYSKEYEIAEKLMDYGTEIRDIQKILTLLSAHRTYNTQQYYYTTGGKIMDSKKIIMIDCNSITSYGELPLLNYEVEYFGLKDGMEIIAYDDEDVWEATVHYNPSADYYEQWYVESGETIQILTEEERKWTWAGYHNGISTGAWRKEVEVAEKLIDFGMEIADIQKIVSLHEDHLYRIKRVKLINKFEEKVISDGGTFKPKYINANLSLHPMLAKCNDKVFCTFLDYVSKAESADGSAWFLCASDYKIAYKAPDDMHGFEWNEFEKISLSSAESDDEKEKIKNWWECHLPVAMSVKGEYSFLAIDLNNNNIVRGYEPDFEDTEVVAENFEELIKMIISGKFTWI